MTARSRVPATPDQVWETLSDLESWPGSIPTVESLRPEGVGRPRGLRAACLLGEGFTWQSDTPGARLVYGGSARRCVEAEAKALAAHAQTDTSEDR